MQKVPMPNIENELKAFNQLPAQLRNFLNYTSENIDPRYILGMYKTIGLKATLQYLKDIGLESEI